MAQVFPTGLALYFLRPSGKFWTVFSFAALAFAVTGLCAAFVMALAYTQPNPSFWGVLTAIGVLRMLVAPPVAIAFVLATFIAPAGRSHWKLLGAIVIEGSLGLYTVVHFGIAQGLFSYL